MLLRDRGGWIDGAYGESAPGGRAVGDPSRAVGAAEAPRAPLPGERAARTARGCARSPLRRAVVSSTVTLVAYACCVAAGNADRRDG